MKDNISSGDLSRQPHIIRLSVYRLLLFIGMPLFIAILLGYQAFSSREAKRIVADERLISDSVVKATQSSPDPNAAKDAELAALRAAVQRVIESDSIFKAKLLDYRHREEVRIRSRYPGTGNVLAEAHLSDLESEVAARTTQWKANLTSDVTKLSGAAAGIRKDYSTSDPQLGQKLADIFKELEALNK